MRELQHVVEVNRRQRRLARHQHQRAALLQHDVGGALDQVVGQAVRDRGQRAHAARAHGHRIGGIGAGSDRCQPVLAREHGELAVARAEALAEQARGLARLRGKR